jgi:hypothetical protein
MEWRQAGRSCASLYAQTMTEIVNTHNIRWERNGSVTARSRRHQFWQQPKH